jgi:hypothetical protein
MDSGQYLLWIRIGEIETSRNFRVSPGQTYESTITVPRSESIGVRTAVQFRVKNGTAGALYGVAFTPPPLAAVPNESPWRLNAQSFVLMLRPDGSVAKAISPNSLFGIAGGGGVSNEALTAGASASQPGEQTVSWPTGTYSLTSITTYRIAKPVVGEPAPTQPVWEAAGTFADPVSFGSHRVFKAEPNQTNVWEIVVPR